VGSYYMGELTKEEIVQADWYRHMVAAPILGMSVKELLELPDFDYHYWVERALTKKRIEQEAQELIRYAQERERTST
jgi:hypothetical protein